MNNNRPSSELLGWHVPAWLTLLAAVLAGGLFAAALWRATFQPGRDFENRPLEIWSLENHPTIGRSDVVVMTFKQRSATNSRTWHSQEFRLPRSDARPGHTPGGFYVPPYELNLAAVRSLGFYLVRQQDGSRWPPEGKFRVYEAQLKDASGEVRFRTVRPLLLREGELLELVRIGPFETNRVFTPPFRLEVATDSDVIIGFRGFGVNLPPYLSEQQDIPRGYLVTVGAQDTNRTVLVYPQGRVTLPLSGGPATRADLVAWLWRFDDGPQMMTRLALVSGLLLAGGVACWLAGCARRSRWQGAGLAGSGGLLTYLAVALPYAWLVPPLTGVDEERHVMSYLIHAGRNGDLPAVMDLGKRAYVDDIRRRTDIGFTTWHTNRPAEFHINPGTISPGGLAAYIPGARRRSATQAIFWNCQRPLLTGHSMEETVLRLRVGNVLLVSLAVGLGAGMLALAGGGLSWGGLPALAILGVPALPFFSSGVHNYGAVIAFSLLLGTSVLLLLDRRQPWRWGVLIFSLGCALHTSRNLLPTAIGVTLWLTHRPLAAWYALDERAFLMRLRSLGGDYGAMLLGWLLSRLWTNPEYDQSIIGQVAENSRLQIPGTGTLMPLTIWLLAGLLSLAVVEAAVVAWRCRREAVTPEVAEARRWPRAVLCGLALVLLLGIPVNSALGSSRLRDINRYAETRWVPVSDLPLPEPARMGSDWWQPTRVQYTWEVLKVFVRNWRIGYPDFLVSSSFWGGFGYYETIPPAWLTNVAAVTAVALLAGLLWHSGRTNDPVLTVMFASGALAAVFWLAALGASCFGMSVDIHGRYMIAFYLPLLVVAYAGLPTLVQCSGERIRGFVLAGSFVCLAVIHAYSVGFVAARYF